MLPSVAGVECPWGPPRTAASAGGLQKRKAPPFWCIFNIPGSAGLLVLLKGMARTVPGNKSRSPELPALWKLDGEQGKEWG